AKLGRTTTVVTQTRFNGLRHAEARALLGRDVIRHIMPNIHFQPGHTYADTQPADPRAQIVLTDLIAPDYQPPAAAAEQAAADEAPDANTAADAASKADDTHATDAH